MVELITPIPDLTGRIYPEVVSSSDGTNRLRLSENAEPVGPFGTLYVYTTVHVSSSREIPYTLGYVDFEEGFRTLAEVRFSSLGDRACDIRVQLKADPTSWWVEPVDREVSV